MLTYKELFKFKFMFMFMFSLPQNFVVMLTYKELFMGDVYVMY